MGEGEGVLTNPDLGLRKKKKASILLPCFRNKLYKLYKCDILTIESSLYHILRQKKVIPNAKSCTDKFTHQSRILVQNDALVKGLRIKILYLS